MTTRINLWSGPRNISTALMYSFAQRADTTVFDEPLYAHYLVNSDAQAYHPGATEIVENMENDGGKVIDMMEDKHDTPVVFFKQMTHHLVNLDWSFMKNMVNIILTRDPREMLPSYAKQVHQPTMQDVGYAAHLNLIQYLQKIQQPIIVIDSKSILMDPEKMLTSICKAVGIPFDPAMLSWSTGPRPEDGIWAKHWYHNVHRSTGFAAYRKKTESFPTHLEDLLMECEEIYEELLRFQLK